MKFLQEKSKKYKKIICESIAKIIEDIRLSKNKSISKISDEVDLSKSVWADLEKGIKDPQLTTLWKIAEALDMPLSEILKQLEKNLPNDISFLEI